MKEEVKMGTTIYELSQSYNSAVEILTARIMARNEKLRYLQPTSKQADKIKGELRILYKERLDAADTAKRLEKYYSAYAQGVRE